MLCNPNTRSITELPAVCALPLSKTHHMNTVRPFQNTYSKSLTTLTGLLYNLCLFISYFCDLKRLFQQSSLQVQLFSHAFSQQVNRLHTHCMLHTHRKHDVGFQDLPGIRPLETAFFSKDNFYVVNGMWGSVFLFSLLKPLFQQNFLFLHVQLELQSKLFLWFFN